MNKYAQFSGRSRRKEFWMFTFTNYAISFGIGFMCGLFKLNPLVIVAYSLVTLIPGLAVSARRLHDINYSGWWMIVPFVNLFLFCLPGVEGGNKYGPDPKALEKLEKVDVEKQAA